MKRLKSIDVLRGLDMFFIIEGTWLLAGISEVFTGPGVETWLIRQTCHVPWEGLRFEDCIFPIFVFIAGLSFPFSYAGQRERGATTGQICLKILRRMGLLLLLGLVYNGFLKSDFSKAADFRYFSVLGKIGIAWGVAALVYVATGVRGRIACAVAGLAAYLAILGIVAPDAPAGASSYSLEGCFPGWFDRHFTFGHLYCDNLMEPSGPFVSFFGFPTALIGMLVGDFVRTAREGPAVRRIGTLVGIGAALVMAGFALTPVSPIVKKLWTPSFVLVTAGYGTLAFAVLHAVVDVRGWGRWLFFFEVIGLNAIAIYFSQQFVNFSGISEFFVRGIAGLCGNFELLVRACAAVGVRWAFLYFLYRQKIFFKV